MSETFFCLFFFLIINARDMLNWFANSHTNCKSFTQKKPPCTMVIVCLLEFEPPLYH